FRLAHHNLGMTLREQGRFAEALVAFRRAHALRPGPQRGSTSAQYVRVCERVLELERELPAILKALGRPGVATEHLEHAQLCLWRKRYAASARFFQRFFDGSLFGPMGWRTLHRYDAVRAAALAVSGQGEDASGLDAAQRARWRRQALAWLRTDV